MHHLALPGVWCHLPDMVVTRVVQEALAHSLVMAHVIDIVSDMVNESTTNRHMAKL